MLFRSVLSLLLHADDLALGEEVVALARVGLASGGKGGELATGGSSSSVLRLLLGGSGAKLVDLGKVGGSKDLRATSVSGI
mgnify:FL=1